MTGRGRAVDGSLTRFPPHLRVGGVSGFLQRLFWTVFTANPAWTLVGLVIGWLVLVYPFWYGWAGPLVFAWCLECSPTPRVVVGVSLGLNLGWTEHLFVCGLHLLGRVWRSGEGVFALVDWLLACFSVLASL
ncbi:MAG: hypothetical protein QXP58_08500 [Thermoprotei archaeon]